MSTVQYFTRKMVGSAVLQELYSKLLHSFALKTILGMRLLVLLLNIIKLFSLYELGFYSKVPRDMPIHVNIVSLSVCLCVWRKFRPNEKLGAHKSTLLIFVLLKVTVFALILGVTRGHSRSLVVSHTGC